MKKQQGFTLIELMIVVAIIGILAAIALPAYQDYTARAQVSEAFTSTAGLRTTISEFAQTNGAYPGTDTNPTAASLTVSGNYSSAAVTADTGVIIITMAGAGVAAAGVATGTITLTPPVLATNATGLFEFTCTSTLNNKFLPATCTGVN